MTGRFALTRNVRAEAEAQDSTHRFRFQLETDETHGLSYSTPVLGSLTIEWIGLDDTPGGKVVMGMPAIEVLRQLVKDL